MDLDSATVAPLATEGPSPSEQFSLRVATARHDLHNAVGQILGFSEMWIEEAQEQRREELARSLEKVCRAAREMAARIHEDLDASRIEAGRSNLPKLQGHLCDLARQILQVTEDLNCLPARPPGGVF